MTPPLHPSWNKYLEPEFNKPYMVELFEFLKHERDEDKIIYPNEDEYFAALNATPFEKVKVIILGQDPYHGTSQAHGLSFSVREGVALPPSLRNIFKELQADLGRPAPSSGDLTFWANQGVLLLNSVLSVEAGKASSHANKGWERFTDKIIEQLSNHRTQLVFVLWGAYAQKKGLLINSEKHYVIKSPHPSPLSAYRGFFGSAPFSRINQYLTSSNQPTIDWL